MRRTGHAKMARNLTFSKNLPDPVNRVDFSLNASFQLMDASTDKIRLTAAISGENSASALIHCTGQADFTIEVDLQREAAKVKGEVAALGVNVTQAKCRNTNTGFEVSAAKLADWLANQVNLKQAVDNELTKRFGEPFIPLTLTVFRQTIPDSNLTISIDLTNVDIVQDELQIWITMNEATTPVWLWRLGQLPALSPVSR